MTNRQPTRDETEKIILDALQTIRNAYKAYYPDADWLTVTISKNYIAAHNNCALGEGDHDHPILIRSN